MSELPEVFEPAECARYLRELGAATSPILPIGEAALALASFERPRVGLGRYRQHLAALARDVGRHASAAGDVTARAQALNEIILLKHGYSGDELTYDDLQNGNLMRVVDRDVLLRLQNNVKSRLLQAGRQEHALRIMDTMLMLAPDLAELWYESGMLHARLGNMVASVGALEEFVRRAPDGIARHQAAAVLQQLKSKLN